MAYEKRTRPYEILVRLKPGGVFEQHVIDIEEMCDVQTGEVASARELLARPITEAEVGVYIGSATAAAIELLNAREAAFAATTRAQDEIHAACRAELEALRTSLASAAASVTAAIA